MTAPEAVPTGSRTVYTGRTTAWSMVAATSIGALFLIVGGATGESGDAMGFTIALTLVAVGIIANVLTASSVRASAGSNGFDLRWGIVGWPHCRYALEEIERAEVVDVPWHRVTWGFWWTPTRTTCTVRSGPALRLVLASGRIVTATVPDPDQAVRAIEAAKGDRSSAGATLEP